MFGREPLGRSQSGADSVNGQGDPTQNAHCGIGNGGNALGVKHRGEQLVGKLVDALGADVGTG